MDAPAAEATSRFSDRILRFLKRVEHRVATTAREREAVYRMRYEAYIRNRLMEPRADGQLHDQLYDHAANAWITMTFIDGEFAATTRVHVAGNESAPLPALGVFADVIGPRLRAGRVIVESTRTAARLDFAGRFPELPYVTFRPAYLAAEHFDANYVIATARIEHLAFYRRVFHFAPWCEPRSYPGVTVKVACMGIDPRSVQDQTEARYPFFRSTQAEREALFGPLDQAADILSHASRGHHGFLARTNAPV